MLQVSGAGSTTSSGAQFVSCICPLVRLPLPLSIRCACVAVSGALHLLLLHAQRGSLSAACAELRLGAVSGLLDVRPFWCSPRRHSRASPARLTAPCCKPPAQPRRAAACLQELAAAAVQHCSLPAAQPAVGHFGCAARGGRCAQALQGLLAACWTAPAGMHNNCSACLATRRESGVAGTKLSFPCRPTPRHARTASLPRCLPACPTRLQPTHC